MFILDAIVDALLPFRATNLSPDQRLLTPEERANRLEAVVFFKELEQRGKDHSSFMTPEEYTKSIEMMQRLAAHYPIGETTVQDIIKKVIPKPSNATRFASEQAINSVEQRKKFEDFYHKPDYLTRKNLVGSLQHGLPDNEQLVSLYSDFQQDPTKILESVSRPLEKGLTNSIIAFLCEKDKNIFENLVRIIFSHHKIIGIDNVDKLLAPIVKKALSSEAYQLLIEKIMHIKEQNLQVIHCPKVVLELLQKPDSITDELLLKCSYLYIPQWQFKALEMGQCLEISSSHQDKKQQQEHNRQLFRHRLIKKLTHAIQERQQLIQQRETVLISNPWILNNEEKKLSPHATLALVNQIVHVSRDWVSLDTAYDSYNNLWAERGITNIADLCVQLLVSIPENDIPLLSESFLHTAASREGEPNKIFLAVANENRLKHLLKKLCNDSKQRLSPLEKSLKSLSTHLGAINTLIKHTDNDRLYQRLIKPENRLEHSTKDDVLHCIQQDYQAASHCAFRYLNESYKKVYCQIFSAIYTHTLFDSLHTISIAINTSSNGEIIEDILKDYVSYLEYILMLSHIEQHKQLQNPIYNDNLSNVLLAIFNNPVKTKEIDESSEQYPILHLYLNHWTTIKTEESSKYMRQALGESWSSEFFTTPSVQSVSSSAQTILKDTPLDFLEETIKERLRLLLSKQRILPDQAPQRLRP